MISCITLKEAPQDGIYVMREGVRLVLFFDLVPNKAENEYIGEAVHVDGFERKNIIASIITDKYDQDDTQAILANYADALYDEHIGEEKKQEYIAEYNSYQEYRDKAKKIANIVISRLNGDN